MKIDDHLFSPAIEFQESFFIRASQQAYSVFFSTQENPFSLILNELNEDIKNYMIIDRAVFDSYQDHIQVDLSRIFLVDAFEKNKTMETVLKITDFFAKNNITKSAHVIIVGGGITQEVGAFACAIFQRGVSYSHFPTTLLSMCDSCIGGKTSLNTSSGKNQLGLIYTPKKVVIAMAFLKTLPAAEIESGLGEILKACILGGNDFLSFYEKHKTDFLALIFAALQVKKVIIEHDEFENNHRRALNYGHTYGHAIEAFSDYQISHGQAVVMGMILENQLSHQLGRLSKKELERINVLCFDLLSLASKNYFEFFDKTQDFARSDRSGSASDHFLRKYLKHDKKVKNGKIFFALPNKAGDFSFCGIE